VHANGSQGRVIVFTCTYLITPPKSNAGESKDTAVFVCQRGHTSARYSSIPAIVVICACFSEDVAIEMCVKGITMADAETNQEAKYKAYIPHDFLFALLPDLPDTTNLQRLPETGARS